MPHGVPFASVTGFGPCEKSVTWTPTGETTQGQCPINGLRFAAPPRFVTTPGSPAQPIGVAASQINVPGLGVKVEWQSNAPFSNAVTLKGFTVNATIKLPVLERVQIERPGQGQHWNDRWNIRKPPTRKPEPMTARKHYPSAQG